MKNRIDNIIHALKKHYGFDIIEKISPENAGRFSDVFRCKSTKKKISHVIKVQKKDNHPDKDYSLYKQFKDEIKLFDELKGGHPNVIKYYSNFDLKLSKPHNEQVCCIELEEMDTDLYYIIENHFKEGMPINIVKNITKQLLSGLAFIHENNIIHTDLKPENILIKKNNENKDNPSFQVCISDLGNGCTIEEHVTSNVGTTEYRAPENIFNSPYNEKMDIWALGCIVFELLTGDCLFDPHSYFEDDDTDDEEENDSDESDSGNGSDSDGEDEDGSDSESSEETDINERFMIDHIQLYLMHSTLGKIPKYITRNGKYFKDFYMPQGNLRKLDIPIEKEKMSISEILVTEYNFKKSDANDIQEFLLPMFEYDKEKRVSASDHLKHDWLEISN